MNTKNIALGHREQTFDKKLVGIVSIRTGNNVAELTLTEEGKKFKNGKTILKVGLDELPKRPVIKPNQKTPREYRVRMNQDGDAVEALTPVNGLHQLRAVSLGKKESEDAAPAPYKKTWNEGKDNENSHLEFFVVYEFADGPFKGVQAPAYQLHYKFEENPEEEGFAQFSFNPSNPKATRGQQLIEWGQVHGGIWGEPIRWDPEESEGISNDVVDCFVENGGKGEFANILPELEERVLDADRIVNGFFDKGYIKSVQAFEDYETEDVEEDEDSVAVDEMLDGDDEEEVKPLKIAHKAAPKSKKAPAKAHSKRSVDVEDDL